MRRRLSALCATVFLCFLCSAGTRAEVQALDYRVLEQRPQPRENFVQGLEIIGDTLLVGTGNYGRSRLRRYDFSSMRLIDERQLHPRLFGEGVTQLGGRIYQLTWRARAGIVYNADDLTALGHFRLPGEGWGLTNDGEQLVYSDGSATLRFLDPDTLDETRRVSVTQSGRPVTRLNELEWIGGRVWANIWQSDDIVILDPATGEVEARLDLGGLLPQSERRADTDVLNGIAYDRQRDALWVTGKHWPYLYRIETVPSFPRSAKAAQGEQEPPPTR
jgi:glutamine cyclotransferase